MSDQRVQFGWRVPDFSIDGAPYRTFRDQVFATLDCYQELYDSAWVADHFFPWHEQFDQKLDTPEGLSHLAYLLGRYPRLQFGSIVLSQAYRPPALLAKMVATLEELSGERFILGLGAGWKKNEYLAYGYEFPPVGVRMDQLEEAVQVIQAMWTEDYPTFAGKYYRIDGAFCNPRPQKKPILMIGGGGRKRTLRIAARFADWWNIPGGNVANYADLLNVLRAHCQEVGRDYDEIVKTWSIDCVAVADTHAEALRQAQSSPFFSETAAIYGTPAEVAAQLREFTDLGVKHFMLRFTDFPSTRGGELFAKEVIPLLRA